MRGRSRVKNADSWNAASPMNIVGSSRWNMVLTVNISLTMMEETQCKTWNVIMLR